MAPEPCSLNLCDRFPGLGRGCKASAFGSERQPGMFSSVGVPHRSKMISSW